MSTNNCLHLLADIPVVLLVLAAVCSTVCCDDTPRSPSAKQPIWNDTWTDILRRDLLTTYDKNSRPSYPEKSVIEISMTVQHIDLDEASSVLTTHAFVVQRWTDPKLRWRPSDYGNVSSLRLANSDLWEADIYLYNSATGHNIEYFGNTGCLVKPNGSIISVDPARLQSLCAVDLRYWPYDEQKCQIVLGSWAYTGNELQLDMDRLDIRLVDESAEWQLIDSEMMRSTVHYTCCPEPYYDLTITFRLQRRSGIYHPIIVTPATVVILLACIGFCLPANSGEKLLLNGMNVVVIVAFLLFFARKLPAMGTHTPYVVLFYSNALYLTATSICLSVVVLHIARQQRTRSVPWFVRSAVDGWPGKLLLLHWLPDTEACCASSAAKSGVDGGPNCGAPSARSNQELREHGTTGSSQQQLAIDDDDEQFGGGVEVLVKNNGPYQHYWLQLATAIDRAALIVYALVFGVLAIVYSV